MAKMTWHPLPFFPCLKRFVRSKSAPTALPTKPPPPPSLSDSLPLLSPDYCNFSVKELRTMMVFMKKPQLKLFGKNILLTDKGRTAAGDCSVGSREGGAVGFAGWLDVRGGEEKEEDGVEAGGEDRLRRRPADEEEENEEISEADDQDSNGTSDESNITTTTTTTTTTTNPKTSKEDGPHKALKKPEKILPCPRCKCSDTKFCYFNNYNVNQPRHFCRGCHRYWTAGGTMRNLPVGSGRRRHKAHQGPNSPVVSFGFETIFSFYPTPCYDYTWTAWNFGLPGSGPKGPVGAGPAKRSREGEAVKTLI